MVKMVFEKVNTLCPPNLYVPLSISSNELLHHIKTRTDETCEPVTSQLPSYDEGTAHGEQATVHVKRIVENEQDEVLSIVSVIIHHKKRYRGCQGN